MNLSEIIKMLKSCFNGEEVTMNYRLHKYINSFSDKGMLSEVIDFIEEASNSDSPEF